MIRTLVAAITLVVATTVLLAPLMLIGLFHPSRRAIAAVGDLWARVMLLACGVNLSVIGRENIAPNRPRVYVGNHQSALDIPVIMASLRGDVRFLAKKGLFRIPVFGWVLRRYGNVPIDRARPRRAARNLEMALARFREKPTSLAIFPEGTRSRDGRLLPFRRGAMKIVQRSGLPVVPFSIDGTLAVKSPQRWLVRGGPVRLTFGKAIGEDEVASMTPVELEQCLRASVADQLGQGDGGSAQIELSHEGIEAT